MLFQLPLNNRAADSAAATRRLLPLAALALASALAAGCSEPPATPQAVSSTATTATQHEGARSNGHEETAAADTHAAHAPAGTSPPTLPATPWATDAPLREGMRRMHRAVEALSHAEHDHLDPAQITAAAQQVENAAHYMITNCKLPPEPDAALHGVLATLMTGASAIKRDPFDTAPVAAMRDAVSLYPRMFADAAWEADTAVAE